MLRNRSTGSSLSSVSTAASIKSEYDSEDYETLLIVRKLLVFKSFGSIYLPVDQKITLNLYTFFFLVTFRRVYSFCNISFYHFDKKILFCWIIWHSLVIDQAGLLEHYISKEP